MCERFSPAFRATNGTMSAIRTRSNFASGAFRGPSSCIFSCTPLSLCPNLSILSTTLLAELSNEQKVDSDFGMRLFRCLWGMVEGPRAMELPAVLDLIKKGGYTGVEMTVKLLVETPGLAAMLSARNLAVIAIAFTDGPQADIPSLASKSHSSSVAAHLDALSKQVAAAAAFGPVLVNVHGGRDFFDRAQVRQYFVGVADIEQRFPALPIAHETHRSRILYSPWVMRDVLADFPRLKLVADLSHFVCVAEALFGCPELDAVVDLLAPNVVHIHARVGFEEGAFSFLFCVT